MIGGYEGDEIDANEEGNEEYNVSRCDGWEEVLLKIIFRSILKEYFHFICIQWLFIIINIVEISCGNRGYK